MLRNSKGLRRPAWSSWERDSVQLGAAILCDYATIREGLLHVLGGGVTRMWSNQFPAPLTGTVALLLELHRQELDRPHEFEMVVMGADGARIADVNGAFQVPTNPDLDIHEPQLVPLALDLRGAGLPAPGAYTIDISIDGQHRTSLRFEARLRDEQGAPQP
jgi:hypothetical protein